MGPCTSCVERDDHTPAEVEAAYKHYSHLYHWVHVCLSDPEILKEECGTAFKSAEKNDYGELEMEELWHLTQLFMMKCECDSPHAVESIYRAYRVMSQDHPAIHETQFVEYMRIVFGVIERDLRDKVTKLGLGTARFTPAKYPPIYQNISGEPKSGQGRLPGATIRDFQDDSPRNQGQVEPQTRNSSGPHELHFAQVSRPIPRSPKPSQSLTSAPAPAYPDRVHVPSPPTYDRPTPARSSAPRSADATRAELPQELPQDYDAKMETIRLEEDGNDQALEDVKWQILHGVLKVGVFNQKLQIEPKNLKINIDENAVTGQSIPRHLAISDEAGGVDIQFDISDLLEISQGITANIMDDPPPAERVVALQFSDGRLCILFDDPVLCQLALKALKQLCQVPVYAY